ncbi:MAG: helix-turn-helix domain-containing protein [Ruminococcaceae bacterium]|nr:helix-turn-helix domain-containing protein [Oscillospiraceae bacterium]
MKINYVGRLFDNTYVVHLHNHELWEVVYYTHGKGNVQIGDEIIPFEKGDIFVIPPNIKHTDYSDTGFKNYHYTFLDFEMSVISFLKLHDTENEDFLRILKQLYLEYHLKRENWDNIVDSIYQVLHQYIISLSNIPHLNAYISKAVKAIISNIGNSKFNLEEMIADIPLNNDYFRKLFQQQIGKTPLQFLTEKRIEYAKQLLRTRKISRLSVKEIAWRSGYSDYYYFSRVFKKQTGFSPSNWKSEASGM